MPIKFSGPQSVAANRYRLCVADTGNHRIQVFYSSTGKHKFTIGRYGKD